MTDAAAASPEGASPEARPFSPWLWAPAMAVGLGLGLLLWQGAMAALSVPLRLILGGGHPSPGQGNTALLLASGPAGVLAGLLVGSLQRYLLRPSLPGLARGWVWASALGHGVGLTVLVGLSQSPDDAVGQMVGPAVWGLCVGLFQAWPLLLARVLRAPWWMVGCVVGFGLDGPVSAVGRALRERAVTQGRMDLIGVLSWGPWLVSLVGVGLVTGLAMRWVLAGPRIPPGAAKAEETT